MSPVRGRTAAPADVSPGNAGLPLAGRRAVAHHAVDELWYVLSGHGQLEVGHRAAAELQQDPYVRAIRRDRIGRGRQLHGVKMLVHSSTLVPQLRHTWFLRHPDEEERRTEIG